MLKEKIKLFRSKITKIQSLITLVSYYLLC